MATTSCPSCKKPTTLPDVATGRFRCPHCQKPFPVPAVPPVPVAVAVPVVEPADGPTKGRVPEFVPTVTPAPRPPRPSTGPTLNSMTRSAADVFRRLVHLCALLVVGLFGLGGLADWSSAQTVFQQIAAATYTIAVVVVVFAGARLLALVFEDSDS